MSEFRHEEKIAISKGEFYILRSRLSGLFSLDEHVGINGFYTIRSLYFDDYRDSALSEKMNGVDRREKFRIRTYDGCERFFLEKKSKINGLCQKTKVPVERNEVQKIISGDINYLMKRTDLEKELYTKIKGTGLRPKVVVAYKRIPFVYSPGNVRVTLDYAIRADYGIESFLTNGRPDIPTDGTLLMEIKWDEFLPDIVRMATAINSRQAAAFSKYALCRMYK